MEQGIEFGLKEVSQIPWIHMNVFTQTRRGIDWAGLDELASSIEALDDRGQPRFEMLHPPLVNIAEPEPARAYVADLNTCFETSHNLDEARPNADGNFVIVVAGHRRRLAAGALITKYGADQARSTIACNVRYNLSFGEALRLQVQENTHLQLPVYEVARAIQATYRYGLKTGLFRSIGDCVRELPFSEDKVRSALRFCELPDFLQNWVEDGQIKYGAAVALHPLIRGFQTYYSHQYDESTCAEIVTERLMAIGLQVMDRQMGHAAVVQMVRERLEAMKHASDLVLFSMDEVTAARSARQRAYRELFSGGLARLRMFMRLADGQLFTDLPHERQEAVVAELGHFCKTLDQMASPPTMSMSADLGENRNLTLL